MKKGNRKKFYFAAGLLASFVLWTAAVCFVDIKAVGPMGSSVGLSTVNILIHNLTGVHISLYTVTDWLLLVPLGLAFGFALLGLRQWITRKHLLLVDRSILILGVFYLAVMAIYLLFEITPVNYRPILIDGTLEASYPSSTTMLSLCILPTAIMQFNTRIQNHILKKTVSGILWAFTVFMVMGRLISGVHWFTDIVGGTLLSAGLLMLYRAFSDTE